MQIVMIPVNGLGPTTVRVEKGMVTVNDQIFNLGSLPDHGSVRVEEGLAIVEYGKDGALMSCQIGDDHEMRFVRPVEGFVTPLEQNAIENDNYRTGPVDMPSGG